MILHEILGSEDHPTYVALAAENLLRQHDFLNSIVVAAINAKRPMVSVALVKALNYHAISCLHVNAGEYRPWLTIVGKYEPPAHFLVPELMNDFINTANRYWDTCDTLTLAAYCLWRLNHIHPFINGNGRASRALCYFVVCVKSGMLLGGEPILPDLIRKSRDQYIELLQSTDAGYKSGDSDFLENLRKFLSDLMKQQL